MTRSTMRTHTMQPCNPREKAARPRLTGILLLAIALGAAARTAQAAEIGHFNGGILNIRDYFVPEPGLYGGLYNYFYHTGRLNDRHGDEIHAVTINPRGGPGGTLGVDVDVKLDGLAPGLRWGPDLKPLGLNLKYGGVITPTFANASLAGTLSTATRRGGTIENTSFHVGDLYVQPVWLGLTLPHWDFAFAYGFYAPTGHYNTQTVTFPTGGFLRAESPDNIGYGFWTNQLQGAGAWYPWTHKATAVTAVLTYEINTNKHDFDLTPGQRLTLNWGISQFLPLTRDQKLLLEVGPAGYSGWQISDDTGSDALNGDVHDQVHAVGGQLGLTYLPWMAAWNLHAV